MAQQLDQRPCTQTFFPQQTENQPTPHHRGKNAQRGHHHQQFGKNTPTAYNKTNVECVRVSVVPTNEMKQKAAYYTGQPLYYQKKARPSPPLPSFQNCLFVNQCPHNITYSCPATGAYVMPAYEPQFLLQPNYSTAPYYVSNDMPSPVQPQYQVPPNYSYQEHYEDETANAKHENPSTSYSSSPEYPQYQVPSNHQQPSVDEAANTNNDNSNYPTKCSPA